MAKRRTRKASPKPLTMVICETVLRDETTKNVTLVGLFNRIQGPQLPLRHDRLHVFVSLTDGHGKYPVLLQCKAPDEKVVFEVAGELDFADPLGAADINVEVRGLVFEAAGNYVFEFYAGGEMLILRRFTVVVEKHA